MHALIESLSVEKLIFLVLFMSLGLVIITHKLKFGVVIGYILAGVVAGPAGLRLLTDSGEINSVSELGVVFLLFLIGLELSPKKLMELRRHIFVTGSVQVVMCSLGIFVAVCMDGRSWPGALVVAMALSLASTPMIVSSFKERNILHTPIGQKTFSVLLFQDIVIVPMIFIIGILTVDGTHSEGHVFSLAMLLKSVVAIAAVIFVGKYLLRPVFRIIAQLDSREIFTAFSLALVLGVSVLMQSVGLSMALGAFLAGVILAESEYRPQLELDINPFKGLLLGLFFVTIGAKLDIEYFLSQPWVVLGALFSYLALKGIVLFIIAKAQKNTTDEALMFSFALSQGGEFAFVLLGLGEASGILVPELSKLASLVIVFSFFSSPLLFALHGFLAKRFFKGETIDTSDMVLKEERESQVIIGGYGRVGQIVGRVLLALKYKVTIIDFDAEQVDVIRKFGWKAFYGDIRNLDLLRLAGADKARLLVVAVDNPQAAYETVELVHQNFPKLRVLVRARDRADAFRFLNIGVLPFRETFNSAIEMATSALQVLGVKENQARRLTQKFEAYDVNAMYEQAPFAGDQKSLIAMGQVARDSLQNLLAEEMGGDAVDLHN